MIAVKEGDWGAGWLADSKGRLQLSAFDTRTGRVNVVCSSSSTWLERSSPCLQIDIRKEKTAARGKEGEEGAPRHRRSTRSLRGGEFPLPLSLPDPSSFLLALTGWQNCLQLLRLLLLRI